MNNVDSTSRQKDLGLEVYGTKDLLYHLLYQTILVIMCVIQLQSFHDKYLATLSFVLKTRSTTAYVRISCHNPREQLTRMKFVSALHSKSTHKFVQLPSGEIERQSLQNDQVITLFDLSRFQHFNMADVWILPQNRYYKLL